MKISYEQKMRDAAKNRDVPLMTIDFDDRHCSKKGVGRITSQGPADSKSILQIMDIIHDMVAEKSPAE